jgi:hypothetical protein
MNVGEVAAPAPRNEDFLSGAFCSFDDRSPASPLTRLDRAHEPRSTAAEDHNVKLLRHRIAVLSK